MVWGNQGWPCYVGGTFISPSSRLSRRILSLSYSLFPTISFPREAACVLMVGASCLLGQLHTPRKEQNRRIGKITWAASCSLGSPALKGQHAHLRFSESVCTQTRAHFCKVQSVLRILPICDPQVRGQGFPGPLFFRPTSWEEALGPWGEGPGHPAQPRAARSRVL